MKKASDFGSEHFAWLVEGRSQNQRSTLELYKLIEANEETIGRNLVLHSLAQSLAAIAFSLWRAVFLSDLTGQLGDQMIDLKSFLQNLIAHNTVLYQTDFNAREWSFQYYLDNASFRLLQIGAQMGLDALSGHDLKVDALMPKDAWSGAQLALESAISQFAEALAAHDPA